MLDGTRERKPLLLCTATTALCTAANDSGVTRRVTLCNLRTACCSGAPCCSCMSRSSFSSPCFAERLGKGDLLLAEGDEACCSACAAEEASCLPCCSSSGGSRKTSGSSQPPADNHAAATSGSGVVGMLAVPRASPYGMQLLPGLLKSTRGLWL